MVESTVSTAFSQRRGHSQELEEGDWQKCGQKGQIVPKVFVAWPVSSGHDNTAVLGGGGCHFFPRGRTDI